MEYNAGKFDLVDDGPFATLAQPLLSGTLMYFSLLLLLLLVY